MNEELKTSLEHVSQNVKKLEYIFKIDSNEKGQPIVQAELKDIELHEGVDMSSTIYQDVIMSSIMALITTCEEKYGKEYGVQSGG